ncbi:MAG TPA: hypothetical protein VF744_04445 [Beijerinckiaceae bacterium]|jgi:uncharacterized protein (DUF2237 family)
MTFLDKVTGFFRKGGDAGGTRDGGGKSDLQKNMEKALAMKQAAGRQTTTPEHQTAREGEVHGQQMSMTDRDAGSQGTHTPQLKRSQVARSGDT